MQDNLNRKLFIELTPQEAAAIKGGRHGADDPVGDDRGGRRRRRHDDPPGHT